MARIRKTPFTKACNLRNIREAKSITANQLADVLDVQDVKHVYAIESGTRALVLSKAARVAYAFKTIVTIDIEGVGLVDVMVHIEPGMTTLKVLSPGEEAWSVMKEHSESAQQISRLQSALFSGDRVEQVRLYRECVLEPIRAAQRLQAALDSYDPTLQAEAMIWATQDMLGFSPSILAPRSIHRLAKEA